MLGLDGAYIRRRSILGDGDLGPKNLVVGLSSLSAEIQSQSLKRQLLCFLPPPPQQSPPAESIHQSTNKTRSGNFFTLFTSNSPVRLALKTLLGSSNNLPISKAENTDLARKPLYADKGSSPTWLPSFSRLKIRNLEYAKILLMLSTGEKNVLQSVCLSAFSHLVDGNPENGELLTGDQEFVLVLVDTLLGIESAEMEGEEGAEGGEGGDGEAGDVSNRSNVTTTTASPPARTRRRAVARALV